MAERLLRDLLPGFAAQLEAGLRAAGHDDLADQVPALEVVSRCGCSLADCATFRTAARDRCRGPFDSMTVPGDGMIVIGVADAVLDADGRVVVGGPGPRIVDVEVLEREDLRAALIERGIPTSAGPP